MGGAYWSELVERTWTTTSRARRPDCRSSVSIDAVRGDATEQLTDPSRARCHRRRLVPGAPAPRPARAARRRSAVSGRSARRGARPVADRDRGVDGRRTPTTSRSCSALGRRRWPLPSASRRPLERAPGSGAASALTHRLELGLGLGELGGGIGVGDDAVARAEACRRAVAPRRSGCSPPRCRCPARRPSRPRRRSGPGRRPRGPRSRLSPASRGQPFTAGVGCSAPTSSRTDGGRLGQTALDEGGEVLHVGDPDDGRLGLVVEVGAPRQQRVVHHVDRDLVLVAVGRRGQQRGARAGRRPRVAAPRSGSSHRLGANRRRRCLADEQLGAGTEEAVDVEDEAARVRAREAVSALRPDRTERRPRRRPRGPAPPCAARAGSAALHRPSSPRPRARTTSRATRTGSSGEHRRGSGGLDRGGVHRAPRGRPARAASSTGDRGHPRGAVVGLRPQMTSGITSSCRRVGANGQCAEGNGSAARHADRRPPIGSRPASLSASWTGTSQRHAPARQAHVVSARGGTRRPRPAPGGRGRGSTRRERATRCARLRRHRRVRGDQLCDARPTGGVGRRRSNPAVGQLRRASRPARAGRPPSAAGSGRPLDPRAGHPPAGTTLPK